MLRDKIPVQRCVSVLPSLRCGLADKSATEQLQGASRENWKSIYFDQQLLDNNYKKRQKAQNGKL